LRVQQISFGIADGTGLADRDDSAFAFGALS
jgi:hypothetical protein